MKTIIFFLFSFVGLCCEAHGQNSLQLYVSPLGKDGHDGSHEHPFRTLAAAQSKIREFKKAGLLKKPVFVNLGNGIYNLTEPIVFKPEDSGTEDYPITYKGDADDTVTFQGGRKIVNW